MSEVHFDEHMPQLPPRITVQVMAHDFGPTNHNYFGITLNLLIGNDKSMSFAAGGGDRTTLLGSFQADLPDNFNLLADKEQMTILYAQIANVDTRYRCRHTREMKEISPENFRRVAVYGNTIDF